MILFALSLLPLLAGPLLVRCLQGSPWTARALDAFILVAVSGLIFLHVLPHAIREGGTWATVAAVIGLFLPLIAEQAQHRTGSLTLSPALVMALGLLTIHGMLDGVALAAPHRHADHGEILALAVVLHRLPAGLAIWWVARPRLGTQGSIAVVLVLVMGTTLGYVAGRLGFDELFHGSAWHILQALLAGSLIHVIVHQSLGSCVPLRGAVRAAWWAGGAAAVAALTLLAGTGHDNDHGHAHMLLDLIAPAGLGLVLLLALPNQRVQDLLCRVLGHHHEHPHDHHH
ncbi:MAG: hypothetical protein ABIK09_14690 [Pseudomonadota bacterium]